MSEQFTSPFQSKSSTLEIFKWVTVNLAALTKLVADGTALSKTTPDLSTVEGLSAYITLVLLVAYDTTVLVPGTTDDDLVASLEKILAEPAVLALILTLLGTEEPATHLRAALPTMPVGFSFDQVLAVVTLLQQLIAMFKGA